MNGSKVFPVSKYLSALISALTVLFLPITLSLQASEMVRSGAKQSPSAALLELANFSRLLILTESPASFSSSHSQLISLLKNDGHNISIHASSPEDLKKLPFLKYGEPQFDNILLATPALKAFPRPSSNSPHTIISQESLLQFVDTYNGNFVVMGLSTGAVALRTLLDEFGLKLDSSASAVADHFSNLRGEAGVVMTDRTNPSKAIFSKPYKVAYEGLPHLLSSPSRSLAFPLLSGSSTTFYTSTLQKGGGLRSREGDEDIYISAPPLVSAMQTLSNSRVTVTASKSLCSDGTFQLNPENIDFCREVFQWTFKQKGVIDWSNLKHNKVGEDVTPYSYTIGDLLSFQVDLHELSDRGPNGRVWTAFSAPNQSNGGPDEVGIGQNGTDSNEAIGRRTDVQMELVMLDPYIRLFLKQADKGANGISPTYKAIFKAPDRYGIFKFVVKYYRKGYSFIHLESLSPLRNFKHDGYPRFIWSAFPYYSVNFVAMLLVLIFSFVFLYTTPTPVSSNKKKDD